MQGEEQMQNGRLRDFLIPILVLVGIAIATGDLLLAVIVTLALCVVLYVPFRRMTMEVFTEHMIQGFGEMLT